MNDRIKKLRKEMRFSQSDFGERIGVSRDTIANIEGGRIEIKDMYIKAICREFNVDYMWLTTGAGSMFLETDDDAIALIDRIMTGENEFHKNLFKTFATLSEEELLALESILDKFIEISKKKKD